MRRHGLLNYYEVDQDELPFSRTYKLRCIPRHASSRNENRTRNIFIANLESLSRVNYRHLQGKDDKSSRGWPPRSTFCIFTVPLIRIKVGKSSPTTVSWPLQPRLSELTEISACKRCQLRRVRCCALTSVKYCYILFASWTNRSKLS